MSFGSHGAGGNGSLGVGAALLQVRVFIGDEASPRCSVLRSVIDPSVHFFDIAESFPENAPQFADVQAELVSLEGSSSLSLSSSSSSTSTTVKRVSAFDSVLEAVKAFQDQEAHGGDEVDDKAEALPCIVLRVQLKKIGVKVVDENASLLGKSAGAKRTAHVAFGAYLDAARQQEERLPRRQQAKVPANPAPPLASSDFAAATPHARVLESYPTIPPHLLEHGATVEHETFPNIALGLLSGAGAGGGAGAGAAVIPGAEQTKNAAVIHIRETPFASLDPSLFEGPTQNVQVNKIVYMVQHLGAEGVMEQEVCQRFVELFGEKYTIKRLRANMEKASTHIHIAMHEGDAWYFSSKISAQDVQERFSKAPKKTKKKAKLGQWLDSVSSTSTAAAAAVAAAIASAAAIAATSTTATAFEGTSAPSFASSSSVVAEEAATETS